MQTRTKKLAERNDGRPSAESSRFIAQHNRGPVLDRQQLTLAKRKDQTGPVIAYQFPLEINHRGEDFCPMVPSRCHTFTRRNTAAMSTNLF